MNATLNVENFSVIEARFVRFTIRETNSGQPCLDELMVFDPEDQNVALGASPTASGSLPGYPIHQLKHINDGLIGNEHSWICNKKNGWVQLEFKTPQPIERIEWARDRNGVNTDRLATDYLIEASLDEKTWKTSPDPPTAIPFEDNLTPMPFSQN